MEPDVVGQNIPQSGRLIHRVSVLPQDQRQTESIQLLQSQLENVTQMVLSLSARVSELQTEVDGTRH